MPQQDKPLRRYRLLAGRHIENAPNGKEVTYSAGDVFDSTSHLESFNGPAGMSQKFEFLGMAPVNRDRPPSEPAPLPKTTAEVRSESATSEDKANQEAKAHEAKPASTHMEAQLPLSRQPPPPQDIKAYHQLLDGMSVEELRGHAAEEEIDLKQAKSRGDILKILKQHTPA